MGAICYQRPCKTGSVSVYKNPAQPVNKVSIVDLVFKNEFFFIFLIIMLILLSTILECLRPIARGRTLRP